MDKRLEILDSLKKEFELEKEVSFGAYIAYVTSIDDLAYMTDEEVRRLIDWDVKVHAGKSWHDIQPGSQNIELHDWKYHQVTKQKEQIAYERYKAMVRGKIFFQLEEVLYYHDFLERFTDGFNNHEYLKYEQGIMAINHNSDFYDIVPHRYVPMYVCARNGNDYTFIDTNSNKIPDAYELFTFVSSGECLYCSQDFPVRKSGYIEADEWFALVFDTEGNCRATSYYKWAHFGMSVRPDKKEVEFYNANRAIEIFHELFGKCKRFINHAFGEYNAEGVDYSFNISNRSFDLTYHEACMLLDDDLEELLKKDKLGYRHLRAFFWVKRHMRYEGESHNHNDWDRHPDDFFEYVEEVIREFFNEKRGENVK